MRRPRKSIVALRVGARRQLHAMAHELATFYAPEMLEAQLRLRAPGLVRVIGERELAALLALVDRPLGVA